MMFWRYWDSSDWLLWGTIAFGLTVIFAGCAALVQESSEWKVYSAANGCQRTGNTRSGSTYFLPIQSGQTTILIPQTLTLEEWRCTTAEATIWR